MTPHDHEPADDNETGPSTETDEQRLAEDRVMREQGDGVTANLPGGARSNDRQERVESGDVGREAPYEG